MVLRTEDYRFQLLQEEKEWVASKIFTSVANNDVKKIFIDIPEGQDDVSIENIRVSTSGKLKIERYRNATEDTQGDSVVIGNNRINGAIPSHPHSIRSGGDNETGVYSGGTKEEENLIIGAVTGSLIGGGTESRPATVVEAGSNVLLVFTNQAGQSVDFSVQIEHAEIDS